MNVDLFLDNISTRRYFKLIASYISYDRILPGELHHVIPRSMGGTDASYNIVKVPYRVHLLLHRLLIKMPINSGHKISMAFALKMMVSNSKYLLRNNKCYSKQYAEARAIVSHEMKLNNPMKNDSSRMKLVGRKRPEQAEIAREVNAKRFPKEVRIYTCHCCNLTISKVETIKSNIKLNWCCGKRCYYYFKRGGSLPVVKIETLTKNKRSYRPNPAARLVAAANGKKGAVKLSQIAKTRKLHIHEDGSRTWIYVQNVKNEDT